MLLKADINTVTILGQKLWHSTPRDYTKFFLKDNPFPAIGIPGDRINFCVDRLRSKSRFKDVLTELIYNDSSSITVLVGDYGSGKSHLLKLFKQSINEELLPQDNPILAAYVKSPGEDFRDFYLHFIDDIDLDLLVEYSRNTIEKYFKNNRENVAKWIHDQDQKEKFLKGKYNFEDVFQKTQRSNLFTDIRKDYFKSVNFDDLVYAFLSLASPEISSKAWKWFQGEKLEKNDKDILKVDKQIDDDESTFMMFREFLKLQKVIGIKSLVLLIDELEKLTYIHAIKRTKYEDKLRDLIDENPKNLCIFFAIAPTQWKLLAKESTAFIRRLAGNWDELQGFEEKDTSELIETYLIFSRVEGISPNLMKERFKECEVSLCPFTSNSVKRIQELTKGRVSQVIFICRRLIDYYYDNQEKFPAITPDMVDTIWAKEGL